MLEIYSFIGLHEYWVCRFVICSCTPYIIQEGSTRKHNQCLKQMSTVIASILIWTYLSKSWRILPKYRVGTPISSPSWSKQWSLEGYRTKSSENLTESDLAISDWMECGAARTTIIKVSHLHTMLQIQPQESSHCNFSDLFSFWTLWKLFSLQSNTCEADFSKC